MKTTLKSITEPLTISEETKGWLVAMAQTNEVYNKAYEMACNQVGEDDRKAKDLTDAYKQFYAALAALMANSVSVNLCCGNEILELLHSTEGAAPQGVALFLCPFGQNPYLCTRQI